ncbi:NAD-dependent epimerase/dehydratase family protein [Phytoactinopolyspora halotolerans]|uniref:NAD(P)-dependent oxidoreductase n=1 Tax=Phytoactinopolyspora halotolerans TaxID=1981512 RepID=A0A6L9SET6_9ACTN|nr:NAD(P)-dependent oxidoreductase [Phytoactinopolyspora halotolerans]NEE02560.1 NAD(P)-dependent oxidoreductase [Phytoactinopolyspora halotolerans]
MISRLLVTGAAGGVARMLAPGLDGYDVRAVDVREVSGWQGAQTAVGDLTDPDFVRSAVEGVDAVVHLAANPNPRAEWSALRGPNLDGAVQVLDAARDVGAHKVVLASSVHAMGGYVRGDDGLDVGGLGDRGFIDADLVDPSWPARPCCAYGATKAFAEAYGYVTAGTSDVSVVALRLGACQPSPKDTGALPGWLAPDDLQRLVRSALTANVAYGTYFGVSANTRARYSIDNARRELGYEPACDSEEYAAELPDGAGGMCLGPRSGVAR